MHPSMALQIPSTALCQGQVDMASQFQNTVLFLDVALVSLVVLACVFWGMARPQNTPSIQFAADVCPWAEEHFVCCESQRMASQYVHS